MQWGARSKGDRVNAANGRSQASLPFPQLRVHVKLRLERHAGHTVHLRATDGKAKPKPGEVGGGGGTAGG